MKSSFLVVLITILSTISLAYSLYTVSWSDFSDYRDKIENITGINISQSQIKVYVCSSTAEFTELSGSPYWVLASYSYGKIYLQPTTIIPNLQMTIIHELSHSFFSQFNFPYWLEEGLVCIITGEWIGEKYDLMENLEDIEFNSLNYYSYDDYSYSCWVEASKLLSKNSFVFFLNNY